MSIDSFSVKVLDDTSYLITVVEKDEKGIMPPQSFSASSKAKLKKIIKVILIDEPVEETAREIS